MTCDVHSLQQTASIILYRFERVQTKDQCLIEHFRDMHDYSNENFSECCISWEKPSIAEEILVVV